MSLLTRDAQRKQSRCCSGDFLSHTGATLQETAPPLFAFFCFVFVLFIFLFQLLPHSPITFCAWLLSGVGGIDPELWVRFSRVTLILELGGGGCQRLMIPAEVNLPQRWELEGQSSILEAVRGPCVRCLAWMCPAPC